MDRRRMLGLFAGLGAAGMTGGLTGCGATPDDNPKQQIRVGLLVPQTGDNKPVGGDLRAGFELYLGQRDNTMGGHSVTLFVEDEGDTVAAGQEALQRLYDNQVLAIAGVASSELLTEIRNTIEEKQVPLLAMHGSSPDMPSAIYIWRTSFVNDEPGRAVGSYLRRRAMGRVGLIGLQNGFGNQVISGFTSEYPASSSPVWVSPDEEPSDSAMAGYASQVLAGGTPEAVFCSLPANHLVPFLAALTAAQYDGPVYAPGTVSEGPALAELENRALGLYTAMHYAADLNNPANRSFSALFQSAHDRSPTAYAVAAYDAASVLDRAVALCGDDALSPNRINQEIPNVGQVISPRGNWEFTQNRAPQQKWYLRQIQHDGPILSNVLVSDLATLG